MRTLGAVLVLLVAAGCGGGSDAGETRKASGSASGSAAAAESAAAGGSAEPGSPEPSPTPDPVSLNASCGRALATFPEAFLPSPARWAEYSSDLDLIAAEGDLETKHALEDLQAAVAWHATDSEPGDEFVAAEGALLDALDFLASRCEEAGSSAFQ